MREHIGHFPAQPAEMVVEHAALLRAIAVVIHYLFAAAEGTCNVGLIIIAIH